jgi:hypothetical protein
MTTYTIRAATPVDAAIIAEHRVAMFRDIGEVPTDALAAELLTQSTTALTAWLRDQSYLGWLAVEGASSRRTQMSLDIGNPPSRLITLCITCDLSLERHHKSAAWIALTNF